MDGRQDARRVGVGPQVAARGPILDIGATAGAASIAESKGPQAFDFANAMKELEKQTGHNDIPKEVEGQKAGDKGGPSQVAAGRIARRRRSPARRR